MNLNNVTGITKEDPNGQIDNAIWLTTESESYTLASFASRSTAYLMLFNVWQNVLINKPLKGQEMWEFVNNCYSDYEKPINENDPDTVSRNENKNAESSTENIPTSTRPLSNSTFNEGGNWNTLTNDPNKNGFKPDNSICNSDLFESDTNISIDLKDSTESGSESGIPYNQTIECTSAHDGRSLVNTILPVNVDVLWSILFSQSKFLLDFHKQRKTTNMVYNDWVVNEEGVKLRSISLTVALNSAVGPKCSHVSILKLYV